MEKVLFVFLLFAETLLFGQQVQPPSEGKAVVYFVRTSSLGALVNFQYYDKDKFIGKFNGAKYMRYECEPGEHIFWARAENADFVLADLAAGRVYFLQPQPRMGAIKAQVQSVPVNPKDVKTIGKVLKLVGKKPPVTFTDAELASENERLKQVIADAMLKYEERKQQNLVDILSKEMYYETAK